MESNFICLLSIWTVERQIGIMSARGTKINNLLSVSFSSFLAQLSHGYPVEMLWVLEIMYTKPNNKTWASKPLLATLPGGSEKARHCLPSYILNSAFLSFHFLSWQWPGTVPGWLAAVVTSPFRLDCTSLLRWLCNLQWVNGDDILNPWICTFPKVRVSLTKMQLRGHQ